MATVVAFHAHPDDEVLLTGGTLARLAAGGNRVTIVVATDGVMGPATRQDGRTRLDELRASASVLGAARVVHLGYADSGHGPLLYPDPPDRTRFARADPGEAAAKLASLIREEHADLLLSYDPQGGYGHRDHLKVHEVGAHAAQMTGVRVLEATLPRELIVQVYNLLRLLRLVVGYDPQGLRAAFSPRSAITHRVDVRRVRVAEARGAGRPSVLRARQGQVSALGQGDAGTARAHLRGPVRTRVVCRTRRSGDHDKQRHTPGDARGMASRASRRTNRYATRRPPPRRGEHHPGTRSSPNQRPISICSDAPCS
jgi:LmbE family N-acetylglucosaminyl deacetylase